jgi:IMP dehydrogenase/GMP reductase
MNKLTKVTYGLDDIGIVQSSVAFTEHRKDVNPFVKVCGRQMYPIFASPMESVVDENNYKVFIENGITPVIPRTVQQRLTIMGRLELAQETFVSFSLNETKELLEQNAFSQFENTLYICIDMAHGTLISLYETCKAIKETYGHVVIMTGNVNNPEAYTFYASAGIDYMRLSIGSGSRCTTACAVGVFSGTATLIDEMVAEKEKWIENHPDENATKIIVDGGIDWYDKIQKSIALGADGVMIGKLFAECEESCGFVGYSESEEEFSNGIYYSREDYEHYKNVTDDELSLFGGKRRFLQPFRMYRGMSHRSSQKLMGGDGGKVSEGICKAVKVKYTLAHWVTNMDSYLRSCMTYTDSMTIDDLQHAQVVILGNNGKMAYAK